MNTICLTGAECTGKTTLANLLAARYGGVVIPEYAREYAEQVARELTYDDVEPIARGALEREGPRAEGRGPSRKAPPLGPRPSAPGPHPLQIHDTDLLSTIVYSRHHYGDCPPWIVEEAKQRLSGLYLLLDVDVPWVADGIRDAGARREQLHAEFLATLHDLGANLVTISGAGWEERVARAMSVVADYLGRP